MLKRLAPCDSRSFLPGKNGTDDADLLYLAEIRGAMVKDGEREGRKSLDFLHHSEFGQAQG
jgi:hypothetical protein